MSHFSFRDERLILQEKMDNFKKRYGELKVETGLVDVTGAFLKGENYSFPKSFGLGSLICKENLEGRIIGYLIHGKEEGDALVSKFVGVKKGKRQIPVFDNGGYLVKEGDFAYDLINEIFCRWSQTQFISFCEIFEVGQSFGIQGFKPWMIKKLLKTLKKTLKNYDEKGFSEYKDSFFMFGGRDEKVSLRAQLNQVRFSQLINLGSKAMFVMDEKEAELMGRLIREGDLKRIYENFCYEEIEKILNGSGRNMNGGVFYFVEKLKNYGLLTKRLKM